MAKAVLVMDMPGSCEDCVLRDKGRCFPESKIRSLCGVYYFKEKGEKPSWCPLKPMPENKDAMTAHFATDYNYALGWNDCLDAIQGKE